MASGEQLELFPESKREVEQSFEPNRMLPRDYYVTNFHKIIETVTSRYEDLLHQSELDFLENFCAVSPDLQKLFVRLISRKGPWFVADELSYDEIASMPDAITEGVDTGLIVELKSNAISEFLPLLTIRELREIQHAIKQPVRSDRKNDLVSTLVEPENSALVFDFISARYKVIGPANSEVLRLLTLLFFGNARQSLSDFVIRDLGHVRYESYSIDPKFRLFHQREVVDQHLLISELAQEIADAINSRDFDRIDALQEQLAQQTWDETLTRKVDRLIVPIAYEYERDQRWDEALSLYRTTELHPSRERRARVYEKQGDFERAFDLARRIEKEASCEEEKDFARIFLPRISKKIGEPLKRIRTPSLRHEELEMAKPLDMRIEEAVLPKLDIEIGFFTQNRIWKSAFGLTFWDIIFAPVEGAFENKFQYAPLDLLEPEFVQRREDLINTRFADIADHSAWSQRVKQAFAEKTGVANYFVFWDEELEAQINHFVDLMNPSWIAAVFEIMLRDLRRYCKGFPDLFIVDSGQPKFIEVKGPGDVLQPTQRMWLGEFKRIGIPSSVLNVSWCD